MDILANMALGLDSALSTVNLTYCLLGVVIGMIVGVIPGIGVMATMAMLFPVTFYLPPTAALIMLAGIWYGSTYGGSIAAILLNLPGTVVNAITCQDGYPMARQGRGGVALFMTTVASFVGGSIGILLLMLFAPLIGGFALRFGAPDYFALMLLGLVAASTVSQGSVIKGLSMVVFGILIGLVGMDVFTGAERFIFGMPGLYDGVSIVALAMGLFGVSEVISSVRRIHVGDIDRSSIKFRAMMPTRDDIRRSWMPMARGSAIGSFFGTLPGTGPTIAAFLSYTVEKRIAREPERFGKGAIEGIMAPETANNAADQTSFIPTLSLGIPGSPAMALMLGALMIHGITPGPNLMNQQPELFWGLIMSFWIGNIILVFLNVPLIGIWVRILTIRYYYLFPAILVFTCIGTYSVRNNVFDVWLVLFFGAMGYAMRVLQFPAAPLLLGVVLGPMLESNFRRSMQFSRGDFGIFVDSPISLTVLGLTLVILLWTAWSELRRRLRRGVSLR